MTATDKKTATRLMNDHAALCAKLYTRPDLTAGDIESINAELKQIEDHIDGIFSPVPECPEGMDFSTHLALSNCD